MRKPVKEISEIEKRKQMKEGRPRGESKRERERERNEEGWKRIRN